MVTDTDHTKSQRRPLSRERVLTGAITLADAHGIDALTMRGLAHDLGVEAMSLYYHVANKEALLDGIVDTLLGEIETALGGFDVPGDATEWKATLKHRMLTARRVMLAHPWAPAVIETRTKMTPTLIRYFDSLIGILINGGFSYDLAHHAMHALGSLALGFNQELFAPDDPSQPDEDAAVMLADLAPQLPHLTAMLSEVSHTDAESTLGWCDDQTEFTFTVDLLLDGLEMRRASP